MSLVINLYGGPGSGKSTTMAALFSRMKLRGLSVEMAPEWVKAPVWAGETHVLEDQLYVLAKQNRLLGRLDGNVDYIITDSPLLMSLVYTEDPGINQIVHYITGGYNNLHVFLERVKTYNPAGRVQDERKARLLDFSIREMLSREVGPGLICLPADEHAASTLEKQLL